jgi:Ribbon-helix-helix protein, copG family
MAKSQPKKRPGRPATGTDPLISTRAPTAVIAAIDAWAASNGASRSEAIRRLVELGLAVKAEVSPTGRRRSIRALELAAKTIDGLSDDLASATDQESRKRRLLKGPEEFREVRIDRTKK